MDANELKIQVGEQDTCVIDVANLEKGFIKPQKLKPNEVNQIKMSYEVVWQPSDIPWASRWDSYLKMTDVQIHWFSIINSLVVVFFLAGILSMILIRSLRRDIAKYNREDEPVRAFKYLIHVIDLVNIIMNHFRKKLLKKLAGNLFTVMFLDRQNIQIFLLF